MNMSARKIDIGSSQVDTVENKKSFSSRMYGFDWGQYFPMKISEDEEIRMVNFEVAASFIKENHAEIFEQDQWGNPFLKEDSQKSKQYYYEEMADCFMFCKGDINYGIYIGTPIDWSSYYIRFGALIKAFRNGGRTQFLIEHIVNVLRMNSFGRVETDVAPSNLANIHVYNKLQFNINGITLTERWGALLHFTKYLNLTGEKIFLDQYCVGTRSQTEAPKDNVISINKNNTRRRV
jgi:hypothetical protein